MIRITLIVLYVTYVSLHFEAFHASIGEVLFIIWIIVYLLAVIHYENNHPIQSVTREKDRTKGAQVRQAKRRRGLPSKGKQTSSNPVRTRTSRLEPGNASASRV